LIKFKNHTQINIVVIISENLHCCWRVVHEYEDWFDLDNVACWFFEALWYIQGCLSTKNYCFKSIINYNCHNAIVHGNVWCGGGGATRPCREKGARENSTETQQSGHAPNSGPEIEDGISRVQLHQHLDASSGWCSSCPSTDWWI